MRQHSFRKGDLCPPTQNEQPCDTEGVILYMNEKARATYIRHGNLIGSNLFGCHNERSREIIRRLTAEGGSNAYTIEKQGVRKMI